MQLNAYLTFNGQCEAAFKFYEQCLGGKIEMMMTHENSPMADQVPSEWRKKIMQVRMTVGDQVLMGSDAPPDHYEAPKGFSVSVSVNDTSAEAKLFCTLPLSEGRARKRWPTQRISPR
jgi:PhnB protein